VGRHVIFSLVAVAEECVAVRDKAGEKALEIAANIRIGILLYDEARGCMAHEEGKETNFHGALRAPSSDRPSDINETPAVGVEEKCGIELAKHRRRIDLDGSPLSIAASDCLRRCSALR